MKLQKFETRQLKPLLLLTSLALSLSSNSVRAADIDSLPGRRVLDLEGRIHVLGGLESPVPFVMIVMGTECPISRRATPRLKTLAKLAQDHGIAFFGLHSDPSLRRSELRKHQQDYKIDFPLIFDGSLEIAQALKPSHIPEVFAFEAAGTLIYRGAIDDSFLELARPRASAHEHFLRDAILALASNQRPELAERQALGCIFEARRDPAKAPTWNREIASLLIQNCSPCHQPDGAARPSFLDYESARSQAATLLSGGCPLLNQDPKGYYFPRGPRLSATEARLLKAWIDADFPKGLSDDALEPGLARLADWSSQPSGPATWATTLQLNNNGDARLELRDLNLEERAITHMKLSVLDGPEAQSALLYRQPKGQADPSSILASWTPAGSQSLAFGGAAQDQAPLLLRLCRRPGPGPETSRLRLELWLRPAKEPKLDTEILRLSGDGALTEAQRARVLAILPWGDDLAGPEKARLERPARETSALDLRYWPLRVLTQPGVFDRPKGATELILVLAAEKTRKARLY